MGAYSVIISNKVLTALINFENALTIGINLYIIGFEINFKYFLCSQIVLKLLLSIVLMYWYYGVCFGSKYIKD